MIVERINKFYFYFFLIFCFQIFSDITWGNLQTQVSPSGKTCDESNIVLNASLNGFVTWINTTDNLIQSNDYDAVLDSWKNQQQVFTGNTISLTDLAINDDSAAVLLYQNYTGAAYSFSSFTNFSNAWVFPHEFTTVELRSNSIAVNQNDKIQVFWVNNANGSYGAAKVNHSTNGGISWGSNGQMTEEAKDGVCVVSSSGVSAVVWRDRYNDIRVRYSTAAGAWIAGAQNLSGSLDGRAQPIAAMNSYLGLDYIIVGWQALSSGFYTISVNYSHDGAVNWAGKQFIASEASTNSSDMQIAGSVRFG